MTKKAAVLLAGIGLVTGAAITLGLQTKAQTSSGNGTTTNPPSMMGKFMGHAPLGGDGNITAINGTTISMQEEADEGGTTYTVDASKATFTNNGAAATIADMKVGDKIFVMGTTTGTNVAATSVSVGHPGMGHRGMRNAESSSVQ